MSLAVVNGTSSSVGSNSLADLNLSSAQSAQIEQILSEMQSGMLSPIEARAQIASIVSAPQQTSSSQSSTPQAVTSTHDTVPLQQYYELPLPQESLKGATLPSYNAHGAATDAVFSGTSQTVNARA
ncbi:MAG TPA: hypothetical protein VMD07_09150 [Candidatus Acidoferrales bacterium]|nr:hypothetical protein [Candidatus Acidoferrales bacterium]